MGLVFWILAMGSNNYNNSTCGAFCTCFSGKLGSFFEEFFFGHFPLKKFPKST